MVAGLPAFVPERLSALEQSAVVHRRPNIVFRAAGIALDENVSAKGARVTAHIVIGIGQRLAGEVQPRSA